MESGHARAGAAGGRLAFADGLRGFAALWVVLFHASEARHLPALKAVLPEVVDRLVFDIGHLGVAVFFVLSGFVMAYTVRAGLADATFAGRFVLRRLVRLTPPYWVSIAVVLVLLAVKARALQTGASLPDAGVVATNALYLEDIVGVPRLNTVYWTLGIEIQFYIAFALLLVLSDALAARLGTLPARLLVFGTSGAISLLWASGFAIYPLWRGGFVPLWFSFTAGALACWGWLAGGRPAVLALVFAAATAVAAWLGRSEFAICAALTAAALLAAGSYGAMDRWLNWRWLQFLGLVSYSLYLLHNPLTGAGFNLVRRVVPSGLASDLIGLAINLVICIGVSYASFRLIELPSQRWSHAIRLKRATPLQPEYG
jgi:peptidoglycan/LPS O-acetylase OafA/YrhL